VWAVPVPTSPPSGDALTDVHPFREPQQSRNGSRQGVLVGG
jgi:hypothetical protein